MRPILKSLFRSRKGQKSANPIDLEALKRLPRNPDGCICPGTMMDTFCPVHFPVQLKGSSDPNKSSWTPGRHPHDGPCGLCGLSTNSFAGNPGRWPQWLPYHGGNGRVKPYHVSCVTEAIAAFIKSKLDDLVKTTSGLCGLAGLAAYDQMKHPAESTTSCESGAQEAAPGNDLFGRAMVVLKGLNLSVDWELAPVIKKEIADICAAFERTDPQLTAEQFYQAQYVTLANAPYFGKEHFAFAEAYAAIRAGTPDTGASWIGTAAERIFGISVEAEHNRGPEWGIETIAAVIREELIQKREPTPAPKMTDDQIKCMVNRFLTWRLPDNFNPDGGISFKRTFNECTAYPMKHEPVGTNLLDAVQAEDMIRYLVDGICAQSSKAPEANHGRQG